MAPSVPPTGLEASRVARELPTRQSESLPAGIDSAPPPRLSGAAPAVSPSTLAARSAPPRVPSPLLGVLLLHLAHPLTWGLLLPQLPRTQGPAGPLLWFPPVGLGLALVAWFGPRAAWLAVVAAVSVALQTLAIHAVAGQAVGSALVGAVQDGLAAAGLPLAWWLYHTRAGGVRTLAEPRSAIQFLFLVPGLAGGLVALAQTAVASLVVTPGAAGFGLLLLGNWLAWALGVLALAPPLLVLLTAPLLRRGWARPDDPGAVLNLGGDGRVYTTRRQASPRVAQRVATGDRIEMAGLAVGTTLFSLLALLQGRHEPASWHLWGAPLLLIVWASMRQGLVGATISATAATSVPLLVLACLRAPPTLTLLLQANLLAECSTAVLVAASSTWLRSSETRYRQVVTHIPVLLYSARLTEAGGSSAVRRRPAAAEVTLISAASEALLGCPPERLLGPFARWLERVHPEDCEVLRAAVAQLERQVQPVTCEYRIQGAANREQGTGHPTNAGSSPPSSPFPGCYRWVRDTMAPFLDADGRLLGWEGVVTDITEQRLLADDLRRTSSMLHALVVNLPTGIFFVHGVQGQPLLVNARARHLLGREDPAAGVDQLPTVHRLYRTDGTAYPAEALPVWQALRHQRITMCDDVVVQRPDGRRLPLVTWAAPVSLPLGSGPAAVWVLEDLTALHQAEAARRDSEGRLRTVVETMAEGLVVQDRLGVIVEVNPTTCALLGRPPERLKGKTLSDLDCTFLREDGTPLPPSEHPTQLALRTGRPVRNLILGIAAGATTGPERRPSSPASSAIRHGPSTRWVLANAMPLKGPQGTGGVVTTFADMTAHVQAQNLLRSSEEKYRGLIESLPVALVQADRSLHISYGNPAVRAMTGYEISEVADAAAWSGLIHPEDLPHIQALAAQALAGQPGRAEYRYRSKDGSEKVGFAIVQPHWQTTPSGEEVVGTTTLILDLTRERQLERELERAQRLELVGRLSSGIAHDFNNLLTVILNLADLARENLPAGHAAAGDLNGITEAAERASSLAQQLLTFGRRRAVQSQRVEINQVVCRTLDLLRGSLPPEVPARADLAPGELFVAGDETQLQQVVMNLCLNARDAMPRGGRLTVRTRAASSDTVQLTVEDEGVGMSEHTRSHLFAPFFSTKDRGTGLGLAIVQQIVEGHGGRIEVSSQLGQGTRFDISWPAAGRVSEPQTAGAGR
jgi:PAS domain S-box-containing protein